MCEGFYQVSYSARLGGGCVGGGKEEDGGNFSEEFPHAIYEPQL